MHLFYNNNNNNNIVICKAHKVSSNAESEARMQNSDQKDAAATVRQLLQLTGYGSDSANTFLIGKAEHQIAWHLTAGAMTVRHTIWSQ